jgi:hypothetical protein
MKLFIQELNTRPPDMEVRCEYIERAVVNSRQGVVGFWVGEALTTPRRKKEIGCYEVLHRTSEWAGSYEYVNEPSGSIQRGEFID